MNQTRCCPQERLGASARDRHGTGHRVCKRAMAGCPQPCMATGSQPWSQTSGRIPGGFPAHGQPRPWPLPANAISHLSVSCDSLEGVLGWDVTCD